MRLSVSLDEDVYRMAQAHAAAEDCSISAAINRLLRRLLNAEPVLATESGERFPVSKCRVDRTITTEDVRRLDLEEEGP